MRSPIGSPDTETAVSSLRLYELNQTWEGSSRDDLPEVQRAVGEIRRLWHEWHGRTYRHRPVDVAELTEGTFELPEPEIFATELLTGRPLETYPALGASFSPAVLDGRDLVPRWSIAYYPFRRQAEAQHRRTHDRFPQIMEAAELVNAMSVMLEDQRKKLVVELTAAQSVTGITDSIEARTDERLSPFFERLVALETSRRRDVGAAARLVTSDPEKSVDASMEAFKLLVPESSYTENWQRLHQTSD